MRHYFHNTVFIFLLFSITFCAYFSFASDQISVDLGMKDVGFGSAGQAAALQRLIQDNPGLNRYQISYSTGSDVVVFGCDLNSDVIIRIHNKPDGHGTNETWSGHVLFRILSAAKGASLNDTPNGKQPGSYQSF